MDIRRWLEKNKVFFQAFPPIPIIIAILIIMISIQANKITLYQTKLIKSERMPVLHFEISHFGDSPEQPYVHEEIIVSNIGPPLQTFQCNPMVFLDIRDIEKAEKESGETINSVSLPLGRYYWPSRIGHRRGRLAILKSRVPRGNLWKVKQTLQEFIDLVKKKDLPVRVMHGGIDIYVEVQYTDIIGEWHEEMYGISSFGLFEKEYIHYYKLPELVRRRVINRYRRMVERGYDLNCFKLSADLLYKKWFRAIQERGEQE